MQIWSTKQIQIVALLTNCQWYIWNNNIFYLIQHLAKVIILHWIKSVKSFKVFSSAKILTSDKLFAISIFVIIIIQLFFFGRYMNILPSPKALKPYHRKMFTSIGSFLFLRLIIQQDILYDRESTAVRWW